MDAEQAVDLPDGVAGKRLPPWILPKPRLKMRHVENSGDIAFNQKKEEKQEQVNNTKTLYHFLGVKGGN